MQHRPRFHMPSANPQPKDIDAENRVTSSFISPRIKSLSSPLLPLNVEFIFYLLFTMELFSKAMFSAIICEMFSSSSCNFLASAAFICKSAAITKRTSAHTDHPMCFYSAELIILKYPIHFNKLDSICVHAKSKRDSRLC